MSPDRGGRTAGARLRALGFRLVGLGLLVLILLKLDLKAMLQALASAEWGLLAVAVALNLVLFGLKSWRWRELLSMQGTAYPWRDAFLAFSSGMFLGLLTPGRVGEMAKALYLKQDQGMPVSVGFANVLMDRLLDLYTIMILGSFGLVWYHLLPGWALALVVAGTVATIVLPVMLSNARLADWGLALAQHVPVVRRYHRRLVDAAGRFQTGLRPLLTLRLAIPILLTQVAYGLFFFQGQLLAWALHLRIGFAYLAVCLSVAGFVTLLPVSISGLGTRDAVLIAMFAPLGIPPYQAVAYSTLFFLTFYIGGGVIGALAWQIKPLEKRPTGGPTG